ncbi:protein of unknown function [Pseudomonas sp. JV551A1]|uniref:Uncharacterized protein n=1 Tax=Pseudomonas inefficax TaxID=2078786 RepID=A0AAQ1PCJ4_9PSED|nr:protein of unknown function [Pseudomonas sp. JV551A1]SPO63961.1 protein of unknown function [Pseudomonas inefficax]
MLMSAIVYLSPDKRRLFRASLPQGRLLFK